MRGFYGRIQIKYKGQRRKNVLIPNVRPTKRRKPQMTAKTVDIIGGGLAGCGRRAACEAGISVRLPRDEADIKKRPRTIAQTGGTGVQQFVRSDRLSKCRRAAQTGNEAAGKHSHGGGGRHQGAGGGALAVDRDGFSGISRKRSRKTL
jgi:folate-dependent tRNA-U54 methylase TrmFO/GidA